MTWNTNYPCHRFYKSFDMPIIEYYSALSYIVVVVFIMANSKKEKEEEDKNVAASHKFPHLSCEVVTHAPEVS